MAMEKVQYTGKVSVDSEA